MKEQDDDENNSDYEGEETDLRTELGRVLPVDQIISGAANAARFFSWGGQVLAKSATDAAEQVKANPNVQEAVNRMKPGIDKLSEGASRMGGSIRDESTKLYNDAPERFGHYCEGAVHGFVHLGEAVERVVGNVTAAGVAGGLSSAYCGMGRNEDDVDQQQKEKQEIDQTYDFVNPYSVGSVGAKDNIAQQPFARSSTSADTADVDVDAGENGVEVEGNDDWGYDDDDDDDDLSVSEDLGPVVKDSTLETTPLPTV